MTLNGNLETESGKGGLSTNLRGGFVLFLITSALSLALLVASLYFFISRINQELELAHLQRSSLAYIVQLNQLVTGLQRSRGLGQIFLRGNRSIEEELRRACDNTLAQIDALMKHPLGQLLRTEPFLKDLRKKLNGYKSHGLQFIEADEHFDQFTDLIYELQHRVLHRVGGKAALLIDQEDEIYDLSDMLINHIFPLIERIGQLRGLASGHLAGGVSENKPVEQLLGHRFLITDTLNQLDTHWHQLDLARVKSGDLPFSFQQAVAVTDKFMTQSQQHAALQTMDYFHLGSLAIERWSRLSEQIVEELKQTVEVQSSQVINERLIVSSLSVLALLPLIFTMGIFYRRHRQALVQLVAQHQEMQHLSRVDTLTGLYNRRPLAELFGNERRRALREGHGLVFAILDVDHFKGYNDSYGHQAGDEALVAVARGMRQRLQRAGDLLFRMGGEEFCYIHSCSDPDECWTVAERLRKGIAELTLNHGKVTVSIGVSFINRLENLDMDQAIKLADEALYLAKNLGRNQVQLVDDLLQEHSTED